MGLLLGASWPCLLVLVSPTLQIRLLQMKAHQTSGVGNQRRNMEQAEPCHLWHRTPAGCRCVSALHNEIPPSKAADSQLGSRSQGGRCKPRLRIMGFYKSECFWLIIVHAPKSGFAALSQPRRHGRMVAYSDRHWLWLNLLSIQGRKKDCRPSPSPKLLGKWAQAAASRGKIDARLELVKAVRRLFRFEDEASTRRSKHMDDVAEYRDVQVRLGVYAGVLSRCQPPFRSRRTRAGSGVQWWQGP